MEDNFYQASTERLIKTPKAQSDKLRKERIAFERERPLITKVMEHLKEDIAARERIDFIEEQKDPEQFMREVAINKQVCAILRHELNIIENKVNMFDKEVKPEDE